MFTSYWCDFLDWIRINTKLCKPSESSQSTFCLSKIHWFKESEYCWRHQSAVNGEQQSEHKTDQHIRVEFVILSEQAHCFTFCLEGSHLQSNKFHLRYPLHQQLRQWSNHRHPLQHLQCSQLCHRLHRLLLRSIFFKHPRSSRADHLRLLRTHPHWYDHPISWHLE